MVKEKLFSVTKKDFREDTFRSGGPGGQHQNKTNSGVRLTHRESGAVGESREHREQPRNRSAAFRKCIDSDTFQAWLKKRIAEESLSAIEKKKQWADINQAVRRAMSEENILVEVKDEKGKWINYDDQSST